MDKMCQRCGLNLATVTLITIESGTQFICSQCKQDVQKEFFEVDLPGFFNQPFSQPLQKLSPDSSPLDSLQSVFNLLGNNPWNVKHDPLLKIGACPQCGWTLRDFVNKGRWGCANDYVHFEPEIKPLLKQIHGSDTHKGRVPTKPATLELLKEQLSVAIKEEKFEEAAKLRDRIRDKENSLKTAE